MYPVSRWWRVYAGGKLAVGAVVIAAGLATGTASAGEGLAATGVTARHDYTYEAWAGADVGAPGWSVYGGLTAALFGDVRDNGWRVRSSASYGEYRYRRSYWDSVHQKEHKHLHFVSQRYTVDALVGYQQTLGPTTVKGFAGLVEEHKLDVAKAGAPIMLDDENGLEGTRRGLKLAIETWTRLGSWGFVQADMSWSAPLDSYAGRVRLGYRLDAHWSAGTEASVYGNGVPDQGRAGGFVRLEWEAGEISLSSGVAGDEHRASGVYGTLNALLRF